MFPYLFGWFQRLDRTGWPVDDEVGEGVGRDLDESTDEQVDVTIPGEIRRVQRHAIVDRGVDKPSAR